MLLLVNKQLKLTQENRINVILLLNTISKNEKNAAQIRKKNIVVLCVKLALDEDNER